MIEYPPCKKCGANHGMGIEDMQTGVITPIDTCRDCLFETLNSATRLFPEEKIYVNEYISCGFCQNENSIISKETCCTGCSRLKLKETELGLINDHIRST